MQYWHTGVRPISNGHEPHISMQHDVTIKHIQKTSRDQTMKIHCLSEVPTKTS